MMRTIVDGLDAVARTHPDRLAVQDGAVGLTFGELAELAWRTAGALAERLGRPGPVAVLTPFDVNSAAALLGVMAAGRAAIPLDADHPDDRNRLIAAHSGAVGVVTVAALAERARAMFEPDVVIVELDRLDPHQPAQALPGPGPDDIAYVLYTSGSTGAPKGVFQDHGALLADLGQYAESFGIVAEDRVALFYPPAVVAGLRLLLGGVLAGASGRLMAPSVLGAGGVIDQVRAQAITVLHASATLFRHVAAVVGEDRLTSVRLVTLGGDRVDWSDYDAFSRICGENARFASHLGSTECSLFAQWTIEARPPGESGGLPVGRAIEGFEIALLGPEGRPVADGEIGEFVVSSRRLTRGYWRDPWLTSEAFSANPDEPELRAYRTGDLGRRRSDGLYEHVGRRDQQVKLRGFRIELAEIESALRACSGVRDGAVVIRRQADGRVGSLAAYIELSPEARGLLPRHLKSMLAQKVPAHMIPGEVVILDALPWLANFKIDRRRLELMDQVRQRPAAGPIEDPMTRKVAAAFEAVLGFSGIGPDDDLMGLGGDSLQAVQIALELGRRFGIEASPDSIDMACPISELAARLASPETQPAE